MKLALSNIAIQSGDESFIYAQLNTLGYTGLEIAPTKLLGENPYDKLQAAGDVCGHLSATYGLSIPSMQSIWYGQHGNIFDEKDAPLLEEYTNKAISFARHISCKSMVFGCPKNRNILQGKSESDAITFFESIARKAFQNGTAIALEANVPEYGTNFINTSEQAFTFARKVKHLRVNYDLTTATVLDESFDTLIENLDLVSHIHISELGLAPIERRQAHKTLANLLRNNGYEGYISIEMKQASSEQIIKILEYIAEVFA